MVQKKMATANFNIVFFKESKKIGKLNTVEEFPLLKYFDSIIMPALTSKEIRVVGENQFLLLNVEVKKNKQGDFVLSGIMAKKTKLEIKSDIDEQGEIILRDEVYSTAPLSTFVIFLKNHRMIFVQNQKGSPTLRQFSAMVEFLINRYINQENKIRKELKNELLPHAEINITGMPAPAKIEEVFKDVKKITMLTLKFFPLNGDNDFNYDAVFGCLLTELRKNVQSKTGALNLNSPKDIEGVKTVVVNSAGTVEPIVKVERTNGTTGTIKNHMISENGLMELDGTNQEKDIQIIIENGAELESISQVSEENNNIYEQNVDVISEYFHK